MIFSTLLAVLFFSSSVVCSTRVPPKPSVDEFKVYIEEIKKIIGHDVSPTLSKFLSMEDNWNFVLSKQNFFAHPYPFIGDVKGVSKTLNELSTKVRRNQNRITGDGSLLYMHYAGAISHLSTSNFSSFFPCCIKVLNFLRDMKNLAKVANEINYEGYKELFKDAPTPIQFMKMLFDSFKSVAIGMPLTYRSELEIRENLLLALKEFNDTPSVSDPDPRKTFDAEDQQSSTTWTPLKKFLVFGGIGLVPLSVIVAMVFFFRR